MTLKKPPLYVLVKLDQTKASKLDGLEEGVIPITPMERLFTVTDAGNTRKEDH